MNAITPDFSFAPPGVYDLTAAGTTQATALLAGSAVNVFSTVASGSGTMLPLAQGEITFINNGANDLAIYPSKGDQIQGYSVDAAFTLPPGGSIAFGMIASVLSRPPRVWQILWSIGIIITPAAFMGATGANLATFTDTTNSQRTTFSYGGFQAHEFLIRGGTSGANVAAFQNDDPAGYSAITFRTQDVAYPAPAGASLYYEHGAIGASEPHAATFVEASRFDTASTATLPPNAFWLLQTGGAFQNAAYATCTLTSGQPTITLTAGGNFPSSINGRTITDARVPGTRIPPNTTIVSGQGTATLTLSANALSSGTFVQLIYGTLTFGQYHVFDASSLNTIDWYTWASGIARVDVYFRMDRVNGRIGVGAFTFQDVPTSELDVLGNATFGTDRTQRFATAYVAPINIWDTGTRGLSWVKVGVNTFRIEWDAAPSRIDFKDVLFSKQPLQLFMDGSGRAAVNLLNMYTSAPPASATAAGNLGDVAWDTGFIYLCTAANTWKRVAIATW